MTLIPGIKQISQVGNGMYIQGAFPVGVGTTEVAYLADPADTRLLAGRDPVIEEVSVGMSGVETDTKYATGAQPLTVTDAMQCNLLYCEVLFSPKQDLHGYSSPWPAGGGVNKFQTTATSKEESGVTWTVNADGTITVSGTATDYTSLSAGVAYVNSGMGNITISGISETTNIAWNVIGLYDSNNTLLATLYGGGTASSLTLDISSYATADHVTVGVKCNNNSAVSGTIKIQVEQGTSATSWSPYSNICPISGWTGADIYIEPTYDQSATPKASVTFGVQSANQWDEEWEQGRYDANGQPQSDTSTMRSKNKIDVLPNASYCCSFNTTKGIYVYWYDENDDFISTEFKNTAPLTYATVTSPETAKYMRFYLWGTSNTFAIAINYPSTVTTYNPYRNYILGGTADVVLGSGSETETKYTVPANKIIKAGAWCYSDTLRTEFGFTRDFQIKKCNQFAIKTYADLGGSVLCVAIANNGYLYIGGSSIFDVIGNTQAAVTQYFTDNPLDITFDLPTPTPYAFPGNQIQTQEGTNYIWTDCGDTITAAYVAVK